jgi:ATP-dependent helicase/nuclease subunit A
MHETRSSIIASDPKNSCWVFASAGSGKTKILVDRIVRLLLGDVAPNKILCVTFTKVAAAEMQQRINARLAELVLVDDVTLRQKLYDLSGKSPSDELIKKARILFAKILDSESRIKVQTIHSFCQGLMKIFPFEAGIKPSFEVMEESSERLLLERAQKETIRDKKNAEIVKQISAKLDEGSLADLLSTVLGKKEKLNFDPSEIFEKLEVSPGDNVQKIFDEFLDKISREENLDLALSLDNSGSSRNEDSAIKIRKFFREKKLENFSDLKSAFFTNENKPKKIYGKNSQDLEIIAQKQREIINRFDEKLNSLMIANDSILLIKFAQEVLRNYSKLKSQSAFLDYNDLIIETNKLLANPDFAEWVKMKMDGSFDHILIDESQDTNRHQWSIIKALCEDFFSGLSLSAKQRSIFVVGDEKQSIFSFQGAEPDISEEIFGYFTDKFGDQFKKIELHDSYRSKADVLSAVDKVFLDPKRKTSISKVSDFDGHRATREGKGSVEIWEKESDVENLVKKITDWVKNKNPGDVMILLRNRTNGLFGGLVKSFQQNKIPFTSIVKSKFSEVLVVQDLLAAAKFVLLPQDDLNLACLLKSPFFDFSESDLIEICEKKNRDQSTIYKALEGSDVRKKLDELITKSKEFNCFEFFYSLSYPDSEGAPILNKFLSIVFNFCQNSSPNLQKFLEFVEKIDPEISFLESEEEMVKISTIHRAKGLQAKIVLIPDCVYESKRSPSTKEKIFWIDDLPIWCARKSLENRLVRDHRENRLKEIFDEQLRLLYVAMTRAEDELYITGFGNSKDPDSWYEILKNSLQK